MSQTIAAAPARTSRPIAPAAVLAPVLTIAAFAASGSPPAADASGQEVAAYYAEHETGALVSSFLLTLAGAALVWFAAQLRGHVRARGRATSDVASVIFGAGLLIAAGFTIFAGVEAAAAGTVDDLSPESLQTLNALDNGMFFTLALGNLLMYGALAVAALRHGAFPRPLGWAMAALAVLSLTPVFIVALAGAVVVYPLLGRLIAREPAAGA
jgi:hypothetical protein